MVLAQDQSTGPARSKSQPDRVSLRVATGPSQSGAAPPALPKAGSILSWQLLPGHPGLHHSARQPGKPPALIRHRPRSRSKSPVTVSFLLSPLQLRGRGTGRTPGSPRCRQPSYLYLDKASSGTASWVQDMRSGCMGRKGLKDSPSR